MEAEQRKGNCQSCGEEINIDDLRSIDFGDPIINRVCDFCYDEIKSEYGLIEVSKK
ncbi:hypothetical protein LCGC14_1588290 [marine sediment metagenome]|uniref:ClpX-type ZB domain-containing protein n=1 Tax=marine sediment metagenome TaxID=412755 RepID=A0A0F8VDS0_9ZZZZ